MKDRLTFCLTLALSVILAGGPMFALASNDNKPAANTNEPGKMTGRAAANSVAAPAASSMPAGNTNASSASAYLMKLRQNEMAGPSLTLMPDGRVLVIGGEGVNGPMAGAALKGSRTNDVDPLIATLNRARSRHTATLLPDGSVFVLGGVNIAGEVEPIPELLSLETQAFQQLEATKLVARAYHTATLLTDGRVLIAGGLSSRGKTLGTLELWDPKNGRATRLNAKMQLPRRGHTAALLPSGDVLFWGGTDKSGRALDNGEVFSPAANRLELLPERPNFHFDVPQLVESLPAGEAVNVAVDAGIALRFSVPLKVETVNTTTITLSSHFGPAPVKVVPAEGGMLAFITPELGLLPGLTYTVSVNGSESDSESQAQLALGQNGQRVAATSVRFTTAPESPVVPNSAVDDEQWIPDAHNLKGDWRTGRPASPWQSLPPLQAEPGVTALAGRVLKLDGKPLANATLSIGDRSARTDNTGRFLLIDIPSGCQTLIIDGHTADRPGRTYCTFDVAVDIEAGRTNVLPFTSWMPVQDVEHRIELPAPTTGEVVATTPAIPGLELRIPAGVVLRSKHGEILRSLTLTAIPLDRPPFPVPSGTRLFFTPQTHDAAVVSTDGTQKGVTIVYPNYPDWSPGTEVELSAYSVAQGSWVCYGAGSVTIDRRRIVPRQGVTLATVDCHQILGSPAIAPSVWPPVGGGATGGDPVDLATGLFVLDATDLMLPDTIPVSVGRVYRQNDSTQRSFGIGTAFSYEMFLIGDTTNYSYVELVLPDGGRVRYDRTSPGTIYDTAIMEHTSTPTGFLKSILSWNPIYGGWDLRFVDGTVFRFKTFLEAQNTPPSLNEIEDRYGNRVLLDRAPNAKVARVTSPNGRWIEFAYDSSNRITQVKDNIGRTVSYIYDASGRLWKVTDPLNQLTEYTYDSSHRMLTIKDARGIVYLTNEYDSNGRVIRQTQADNTTYQFAYMLDGSGKVTQTDLTDPRGNVRRVTFNSSGYSLTDTYAQGTAIAQTFTYARQAGTNLVSSATDPLGRRTDFTYNAFGNVTSITQLAGTADAVTATFTYEPNLQKPASVTDPLNRTTTVAYDSKGNLVSITDPLNHQSTFTYNSAGQVLTATNALNQTAQFGYEGGDLATITNPLGHTGKQFVDAAGRLLAVTDSLGRTVRYEYDALNRMTKATDPLQGVTSFSYDPNNNLLSVTDARGNAITYVYDNMDRVTTRRDPLLRNTTYQYNANGALQQVTDRKSQATSFTYDALDRLTQIAYADGSTVTYTYDAGDRVTQIVDSAAGTISYTYDGLDRLLSETTSQGTVSYTYDAVGRRTTMSVPGQLLISYSYDDNDRLTQITQGSSTVSFAYDNANRRTSLTLPNGVVTEYSYDGASRLIGLTYKKGATALGDLTYEYDLACRRVKVGGSFARTGLPQPVSSASYNAANHQLTFGGQSLTYDLNGNLTSDGVNSYTWNARNQLVSLSGAGLSASFQYDPVGRRSTKSTNGVTTGFSYDGLNGVQETVGGGVSANSLLGGIDGVLSRTDSSGATTPLTDILGSVVALTNGSGVVQTEYTYEPFGKTSSSGASSSNPSQYTGRENDGDGLYYYRARYYSPSLQRFISEDPIGLSGGINLYAYVGNDPINFTDPFGLKPKGSGRPWGGRRGPGEGGWPGMMIGGRPYWVAGGSGDSYWDIYDGNGDHVARAAKGEPGLETDWGVQLALAAPFAALVQVGGAAALSETAATRFIARESGAILDTATVNIPGAVKSAFGKLDYLLGRVPTVASAGKGGFFRGVMGFSDESLSSALRSHLVDNFGNAAINGTRVVVRAPMTGANGRVAIVQSVWQVTSQRTVDFITAFPK